MDARGEGRQMIGVEAFAEAVSTVLEADGLLPSPADWLIMSRWYDAGTPAALALETIQRIRERDGIRRRLAYYSPAVDEARQDLCEMQSPGARQAEEPCGSFELFATAGRSCLHCGFPETDHDREGEKRWKLAPCG